MQSWPRLISCVIICCHLNSKQRLQPRTPSLLLSLATPHTHTDWPRAKLTSVPPPHKRCAYDGRAGDLRFCPQCELRHQYEETQCVDGLLSCCVLDGLPLILMSRGAHGRAFGPMFSVLSVLDGFGWRSSGYALCPSGRSGCPQQGMDNRAHVRNRQKF